mmetsp:Transcript_14642/g.40414  ORF Transcript_14642/g.40414 Transcript_14642/m.40414 type:complete len:240 (+) Transcript_14642:1206-1925(+)
MTCSLSLVRELLWNSSCLLVVHELIRIQSHGFQSALDTRRVHHRLQPFRALRCLRGDQLVDVVLDGDGGKRVDEEEGRRLLGNDVGVGCAGQHIPGDRLPIQSSRRDLRQQIEGHEGNDGHDVALVLRPQDAQQHEEEDGDEDVRYHVTLRHQAAQLLEITFGALVPLGVLRSILLEVGLGAMQRPACAFHAGDHGLVGISVVHAVCGDDIADGLDDAHRHGDVNDLASCHGRCSILAE